MDKYKAGKIKVVFPLLYQLSSHAETYRLQQVLYYTEIESMPQLALFL